MSHGEVVKPAEARSMSRNTCAACGRLVDRICYCRVGNNTVPFCGPQCAKAFGAGRAAKNGEAAGGGKA